MDYVKSLGERGRSKCVCCAVESFHWNNAPYFTTKTFKHTKTNGRKKDIN